MSKGTLMLNGVDYSNAGGGGSMVNYSTEEQVIGTWIDGKKLYQKTIIINNMQMTNETTIQHNVSNVDTIIIRDSVLINTESDVSYSSSSNGFANIPFGFRVNKTNIFVIGSDTWNGTIYRTWYLTIQYTKTTD